MDKLSANYAHLLGHQNQKQKIKHIMKLKEDIAALKNVNTQAMVFEKSGFDAVAKSITPFQPALSSRLMWV